MHVAAPLVSVIIPTYNRAELLKQAMASALGQTVTSVEVLVVDDDSTDHTREVVKQTDDERVRYIWRENGGLSVARNTGIEHASGQYIVFLDSDDLLLSDYVAEHLAAFQRHPDVGAVYSKHRLFSAEALDIEDAECVPSPDVVEWLTQSLWVSNQFPVQAVMARSDLVHSVGGFDVALRYCEDWDFWIRLSQLGRFCGIDKVLSGVRVHASQMSANHKGMLESELAVIERYSSAMPDGLGEVATSRAYLRRGMYVIQDDPVVGGEWLCKGVACSPVPSDALRSVAAQIADACGGDCGVLATASDCVLCHLPNSVRKSEEGRFWGDCFWVCYQRGWAGACRMAGLRFLRHCGVCSISRGFLSGFLRCWIAGKGAPRQGH